MLQKALFLLFLFHLSLVDTLTKNFDIGGHCATQGLQLCLFLFRQCSELLRHQERVQFQNALLDICILNTHTVEVCFGNLVSLLKRLFGRPRLVAVRVLNEVTVFATLCVCKATVQHFLGFTLCHRHSHDGLCSNVLFHCLKTFDC